MKTDSITIGRCPLLTLQVLNGIAERERRKVRRRALRARILRAFCFIGTPHVTVP